MLGNIGGRTCFCLYGSALWLYAMVPVKYYSVALWNRVALGSSIEDRTQRNPLIFSYFWVRIPIYFLFLGHCHSYFPIFQVSFVT